MSVPALSIELAVADYGFHVAQHDPPRPSETDAVRLVAHVLDMLRETIPGKGPLIVFDDGRIDRGARAIIDAHEALALALAPVDPVTDEG